MAGSFLEEYKERILRELFDRKPSELTVEAVEISRGAYGVVLKGMLGERPVAVKKIHQLLWGNAASKEEARYLIEGFAKEARMLAELSHAHVVKSFGAFFDSNSREPILVMELMDTDLRAFLKQNRGTLRLGQQLSFVWQVASGVQYLHHLSPPLAHRDLNDKNVLLAFDRTTVKIGDLGQAKYKQASEYFNSKAPGNVHFMPPEATSDKPQYTISVDVYSLGVLAIEIATQCEPSPSTHGIGFRPEVERRAADLAKMADSHPLKSLAMRCLSKEYKERPVIDQLVSELMAVLFTGCEEMAVLKDNLAQLEQKHSAAIKDLEFGLMEKLKKLEADNDHRLKEQDEKLVKLNEEQKKVRLDLAEQNSLKTQTQLAHFSERDVSLKRGDAFAGQYAAHDEREYGFQFKAPVRVTLIDPSVITAREASMQLLQRQQSISQEVSTNVAESPDRTEQSKKESNHNILVHADHCSSGTVQQDSTPINQHQAAYSMVPAQSSQPTMYQATPPKSTQLSQQQQQQQQQPIKRKKKKKKKPLPIVNPDTNEPIDIDSDKPAAQSSKAPSRSPEPEPVQEPLVSPGTDANREFQQKIIDQLSKGLTDAAEYVQPPASTVHPTAIPPGADAKNVSTTQKAGHRSKYCGALKECKDSSKEPFYPDSSMSDMIKKSEWVDAIRQSSNQKLEFLSHSSPPLIQVSSGSSQLHQGGSAASRGHGRVGARFSSPDAQAVPQVQVIQGPHRNSQNTIPAQNSFYMHQGQPVFIPQQLQQRQGQYYSPNSAGGMAGAMMLTAQPQYQHQAAYSMVPAQSSQPAMYQATPPKSTQLQQQQQQQQLTKREKKPLLIVNPDTNKPIDIDSDKPAAQPSKAPSRSPEPEPEQQPLVSPGTDAKRRFQQDLMDKLSKGSTDTAENVQPPASTVHPTTIPTATVPLLSAVSFKPSFPVPIQPAHVEKPQIQQPLVQAQQPPEQTQQMPEQTQPPPEQTQQPHEQTQPPTEQTPERIPEKIQQPPVEIKLFPLPDTSGQQQQRQEQVLPAADTTICKGTTQSFPEALPPVLKPLPSSQPQPQVVKDELQDREPVKNTDTSNADWLTDSIVHESTGAPLVEKVELVVGPVENLKVDIPVEAALPSAEVTTVSEKIVSQSSSPDSGIAQTTEHTPIKAGDLVLEVTPMKLEQETISRGNLENLNVSAEKEQEPSTDDKVELIPGTAKPPPPAPPAAASPPPSASLRASQEQPSSKDEEETVEASKKVSEDNEQNGREEGEVTDEESEEPERKKSCTSSVPPPPIMTEGGRLKYHRDYLLLFKKECTDPPKELIRPDSSMLNIIKRSEGPESDRQSSNRDKFAPAYHPMPGPSHAGNKRGSKSGSIRGSRPGPKIIEISTRFEPVELQKAENAWKRASEVTSNLGEEENSTAELYRKFQSILNKLTPQKFQKLAEQAKELAKIMDTQERMSGCIERIFVKALEEPVFSVAYAKLCLVLAPYKVQVVQVVGEENQTKNKSFRALLLTKCQQEFEKDKKDDEVLEKLKAAVETADNEEEKKKRRKEYNAVEFKSRHRSLGNIRFIGELFKFKLLSEAIIHECIQRLLSSLSDEDSLECFAKLISTIGKELDHEKGQNLMKRYFTRVDQIIEVNRVGSRVKFMLHDVVDLKKNDWVPRTLVAANMPTTIDKLHEQHQEQAEEMKRSLANSQPLRRMPQGGDRQRREEWNPDHRRPQPPQPQVLEKERLNRLKGSNDPPQGRRLGGSVWAKPAPKPIPEPPKSEPPPLTKYPATGRQSKGKKSSSGPSGGSSAGSVGQRKSSAQLAASEAKKQQKELIAVVAAQTNYKPQPPTVAAAVSDALSEEQVEKKAENVYNELCSNLDYKEACQCVSEMRSPGNLHKLVFSVLNVSMEKSAKDRNIASVFLMHLLRDDLLSQESLMRGLNELLELAEDLECDLPKFWDYVAEVLAHPVASGALALIELTKTPDSVLQSGKVGKLVAKTLQMCTQLESFSQNVVAKVWSDSGLNWTSHFRVEPDEVKYLIEDNKLEFLSHSSPPLIQVSSGSSQVDRQQDLVLALEQRIGSISDTNEDVMSYIKKHHNDQERCTPSFVFTLSCAIGNASIRGSGDAAIYNLEVFTRRCKVLQPLLDCKEELQEEVIYGLQCSIHKKQHPKGVLDLMFTELYESDVVVEDVFLRWFEKGRDEEGRGVALLSVDPFITWLKSDSEDQP